MLLLQRKHSKRMRPLSVLRQGLRKLQLKVLRGCCSALLRLTAGSLHFNAAYTNHVVISEITSAPNPHKLRFLWNPPKRIMAAFSNNAVSEAGMLKQTHTCKPLLRTHGRRPQEVVKGSISIFLISAKVASETCMLNMKNQLLPCSFPFSTYNPNIL